MTLLEQMKAALARKKSIEATATAGDRELTAAEQTEITDILASCKAIKAKMDEAAEFESFETDLNAGAGRQTGNNAAAGGKPPKAEEDTMQNWATAGEFFSAVYGASQGHIDQRLMAGNANTVGSDGGEVGFQLPPAMRKEIFTLFEKDQGDLMSMVTSETTGSNSVKYLKDVTTPWEAAGIVVHWDGDETELKPVKFNALTQGTAELHGVSVFVHVEEDLLEDAPRLGPRLLQFAPLAMRYAVNEAIRTGNGVGKPQGFLKSKALVTVSKESGQAAGSLTIDNFAQMFTRMLPSSIAHCHWEIHHDLLPELIKLKDDAGNLLFTSRDMGVTKGPAGTILGRPVIFNEHPEKQGDAGDVQLIDPRGYYMPKRTNAEKFAESIHLHFDKAVKSFRWRFKVGGQTFLTKPIKSAKSNLEKSHFVALGARK
jgi:HK97 family phage major capsid protein